MMLCASSLLGCQATKGKTHKQWVDNADTRWKEVRSTAKLNSAIDAFEAGAIDRAEAIVSEAAGIDPTNPKLHLLSGRIALERSQLERAYSLFELSNQLDPERADGHYYRGVVLQRWKQHELALEAYEKAYKIDPENPARLLAVGETLAELDRAPQAIERLEEKKFYYGHNAGVRALLGHLYRMTDRHGLAAESFLQATLLDPENLRLQEELAFSQTDAQRFSEASQTLRSLLDRPEYETRADLKRSLARAETENGRLKEARQIYIDLTRADPTHTADWLRLGEIAWKLQDNGGALIAANRAITLSPQREEGYLLAGMVWQKRGRVEDALEMFDRAAELAPTDATPLILRGISLQKTDRIAAAAEAYEEALRRDPSDNRAQRLLAQVTAR